MNLKKTILGFGTGLSLAALVAFNAQAQVPQVSSDGKDSRTDYILSASLASGARVCGASRPIAGAWVIDTEAYFNHNDEKIAKNVPAVGGFFSPQTGVFTAPITGFYHINASVRAETGAVDVTLRRNGTRIAALGTDLIARLGDTGNYAGTWSSHSVSKNVFLNQGDAIDLYIESGQSNECIAETNFKYNQFNVHLLRAVGGEG